MKRSNLLVAHAVVRQRELAIRAALGATRGRIARQLFTETLLLTAGGAAAGWLLAAALPGLVRLAADAVPRLDTARLSLDVFGYCALLTIGTTFAIGLLPSLRGSRTDVSSAVAADGERASPAAGHARVQRWVAAAEMAASLVLMVGAMLLIQTFVRMRSVDLGFNPDQIITLEGAGTDQRRSADARSAVYRRNATPRDGSIIINDTAARLWWPDSNALGQYVSTSYDRVSTARRRVIGIVADARADKITTGPPAEVYVPHDGRRCQSIDGGDPFQHVRDGRVRQRRARAGGDRGVWSPCTQRRPAAARDRHPHGPRRDDIRHHPLVPASGQRADRCWYRRRRRRRTRARPSHRWLAV
jgi:hypothetical protein